MTAGKKKPEEKEPDTPGIERTLRDDAEQQLARSPKRSPDLKGQKQEQLIHELEVHQVELEMQAEELMRAHIALEESRDKYLDLYDFAPIGYLSLTETALIVEVNLAGATLLGADRKKLLKARFRKFVAQKDFEQWDRYFVNVLDKGEKQTCTLTLKRSDGSTFPARMEGIRLTASDGITTARIAISDITDIWQIEALRASEERFHSLFERHDSVMLLIAPDSGKIIEANLAAARFYGRSQKELRSLSIDEINIMSPEEIAAARMKAARDQENFFTFSHRLASGEIRAVEVHSSPIDIGGTTVLFSIVNDITDRRRVEEELKRVSQYTRSLIEVNLDPLVTISPEGKITDVNEATIRATGVPRETLIGSDFSAYFTDPDKAAAGYRKVLADGSVRDYPLTLRHTSGRTIEVLYNASVYRNVKGELQGVFAAAHDVTERKKAETWLRESEANLRAILDATPFPVALVDLQDSNIHYWSRSALTLFGHTAPTTAEWYQLAYPDPDYRRNVIDRWKPCLEEARLSGQPVNTGEYRVTCSDGSVRICELYAAFLPGNLIVTFNDVTERTRGVEALRESERKFCDTVKFFDEGYYSITAEGVFLDHNPAFNRILDIDPAKDLKGERSIDFWENPDDRETYMNELAMKGSIKNFEVRVKTINNRKIVVLLNSHIIRDKKNKPVRIDGTVNDITDRKVAELELQRSEEKYRALFANAQVGMFRSKIDGTGILDLNPKLTEIFGYTREEMLGNPATIRWALPDKRNEMLKQLNEEGTVSDIEIDIITKQNQVRTCLVSLSMNQNQGYLEGSATDITGRKRDEEELRKKNADLEAANEEITANEEELRHNYLELQKSQQELSESEERFRIIAQNITDVIYEWDLKDRVDWYGDIDGLIGYPNGGFPRTLSGWVASLHPDDKDRVWKNVEDQLKGISAYDAEYRIKTKDGEWRWWSARGTVIKDERGEPRRWIGAISNITELKVAEEALQENEEKYRSLFTRMIDGSALHELVFDASGNPADYRILDVNPAFERIIGIRREDVIGKTSREVFGVDTPPYLDIYARVAATGQPEVFETYFAPMKKHFSISIYSPEKGKFATVFDDITERKQAEAQLLLKNNVFESSIAANSIANNQGIITHVNPAFLILWGYQTQEEATRNSVSSFFAHEEDGAQVLEALNTLGRWEGEFLAKKTDGSTFITQGVATVIRDEKGEPIGYQSTNLDITERKRAEDELKNSLSFLNSLIDQSPLSMWIADEKGTLIRINKACCDLFSLAPVDVIGKYNIFSDNLILEQGFLPLVRDVFLKGQPANFQIIYDTQKLKNLELERPVSFILDVTIFPIKDAGGKVINAVIQHLNITKSKLAEEALQESEERFRKIFENSPLGMVLVRPDFRFFFCQSGLGIHDRIFRRGTAEDVL